MIKSKYFKSGFFITSSVYRTNGVYVGSVMFDSSWGKFRFIPKAGFSFDKDDLKDLANFLKQYKR